MLSFTHLRRMYSSAKALGLNLRDTMRWFGSYYLSRLPGFDSRNPGIIQIRIRDKAGRVLPVLLQKNGFDWDTVDEIFVQNIYTVELENIRTILDLGANIGLAALYFNKTYPDAQICSVEPIPHNLAVLERNVESKQGRVKVIRAAAGAQDGTARFELSPDPRSHSSVGTKGLANLETIDVKVLSVPSLMQSMRWTEVDLLKIDIEGGEVEVLGNCPAWLAKVKNIIGEGHLGSGYTIDICRKDLEPMGFKVELLRQNEGSFLFLARRLT